MSEPGAVATRVLVLVSTARDIDQVLVKATFLSVPGAVATGLLLDKMNGLTKITALVFMLSSVVTLTTANSAVPSRTSGSLSPTHFQTQTRPSKQLPASTNARLRSFEQFVTEQLKKDKIPGMTVGFTKAGVTWVKGFGYADLENKIPAKPESAYRLASITKTMTGTAIVQLAERGKIKLDEEIQTYLPYYPKQKWPVTVRQLLLHLGGGQTGSGIGPEYVSPRDVVARIAKYPIKNEPGVKFDYQTAGYNLLGAAIEEVTGKSLGEYFTENLWKPMGMNDTRMDSVQDLIPNRVRGYVVEKGEFRNAPYLDVSSRFGGGGATGTVPDLLRWAGGIDSSGILSKPSLDLMFTPAADKSGHYVGIDEGTWYYTFGWMVFAVNGQTIFFNDGGQQGTNTFVLHFPTQKLSIAIACNRQDINRWPYIKRLYHAVTGQYWDIPVYTKDRSDTAIYEGMNNTFNYGSLYFDQFKRPETIDPKALASAFAYFNKNVSRSSLDAAFQATTKAINDGRHPIGDTAFIKVGSYIAMKLREKYGVERMNTYPKMGAIPFFADYVEMYKASPGYPKELRFNAAFEEMVTEWNRDWSRTWTDSARNFIYSTGSPDLKLLESNFSKLFTGAEVYPNLMGRLLEIRQSYEPKKEWPKAAQAAKVAADLYPQSDVTNTYYAISLIILHKTQEASAVYKKAVAINPNGIAGPKASNQIALALLAQVDIKPAIEWLQMAVEIYPREAALYATLGDLYLKQALRQQAIDAYKKAVELDPSNEVVKEALKKLKE